jgi:hypothetical protein
LIAVLLALRGPAVSLGLAGAMVFSLAIAPLGKGSAFPFSLIVGLAAALLLRQRYEHTLPGEIAGRVRRRRANA